MDDRAIVHPDASLADDVSVGPFSIIGPEVRIGRGTRIGPHVTIDGRVTIGEDNRVWPYCAIGYPPQDLKYDGAPTEVIIGDRNVLREYCQVHRGTRGGGGVTRIGNDGFFMVGSHIAHDCVIGDHVIFANAGTLAGHVVVEDHATIGAFSGVHQFCRIGRHAFIGGYSVVTRDALPYCLTVGNRALCYGINIVGLKRAGFPRDTIRALDRAARALFRPGARREDALASVEQELGHVPEVREMIAFIRGSQRGVIPIRLGAAP
ncbi:MAG: acyl-ACP--UDP-N-acetylglucosamine O-acyltransferase [Acidobacteria bacterium]|nr:MAG: acyl-ACP--UDP-N-acetylglucosamine O-acyltransferase [Acidobacteriota bacterium]